uniref:TLDc domain-containing protein n=1 Tax=Oryza meridionalis TaxID=40149 RepID=A0A0E0DJK9_9ORYZ
MQKAFEKAVLALKVGEISDVVDTDSGAYECSRVQEAAADWIPQTSRLFRDSATYTHRPLPGLLLFVLLLQLFLLLHPLGSPGVDRFSFSPTSPPSTPFRDTPKQPPRVAATTATPATMGASTSTGNPSPEEQEQREQETLASASLALPLLRGAFSRSSASLAEALSPPPADFRSDSPPVPPHLHGLVARLGPAIASLFFSDVGPAGDAAGWLGFLRGFNRCCARVPASQSLALLLRVYAAACADAGAPCGLQFHPDEDGAGGEGKVVGELAPGEIAVLLWMCWVMAWSGSGPGVSGGQEGGGKGEPVLLPDVTHLVLSALVSAGAVADDAGVWGWEVSRGGKGVKVQEFTSWVLSTAAGLGNCLSRYVQERFRSCAADPVEVVSSWKRAEPVLVFGGDNVDADQRWGIGILTEEGLQNKDTFYGKEKNFIYCHLHPQIRVYEAKPKPVGLGFGGTIGNERIFLDEDFSKLTVRHHAVDKAYQHGSLIPNQGYLPVEASVLDVEVWGLGGEATRRQQDMYKKREDIFSEQRRKVDLKTFGNWEDSPEKMMMDMISDPNAVRREDR